MAKTKYAKGMLKMRELGMADCIAGKPITAFPDWDNRPGIMKLFADRARAAYEMGWRYAKDEGLTPQ